MKKIKIKNAKQFVELNKLIKSATKVMEEYDSTIKKQVEDAHRRAHTTIYEKDSFEIVDQDTGEVVASCSVYPKETEARNKEAIQANPEEFHTLIAKFFVKNKCLIKRITGKKEIPAMENLELTTLLQNFKNTVLA